MRFWKFQIFEKCPGPIFQKPAKKWCFENAPHLSGSNFSKTRKKMVFEKIQIFDQLGPSLGPPWAHPLGPSLGPPTWAQLGPTHLGPGAAAGAGASAGGGRILKSRSRPLPTHPGMKYFRKETLAVDINSRIAKKQLGYIQCLLSKTIILALGSPSSWLPPP